MDGSRFDQLSKAVMRSRLSRRATVLGMGRPVAVVTAAAVGISLVPHDAAAQATPEAVAQATPAGLCCMLEDLTAHEVIARICTSEGACPAAGADEAWRGSPVSTCDLCPAFP